MSSEEIPSIPRPARLPTPVEAVPAPGREARARRPEKRAQVVAAGALFVVLMAVMSIAAGAIMLVMFV